MTPHPLSDHDHVLTRHRVTLTFDIPIRDVTQPVVDAANRHVNNYAEYREEAWFLEGAAQQRALLHAVLADPQTRAEFLDILARQHLLSNADTLADTAERDLDGEERQLLLDAAAGMPGNAGQPFQDAENRGMFSEYTEIIYEATRAVENVQITIDALPG